MDPFELIKEGSESPVEMVTAQEVAQPAKAVAQPPQMPPQSAEPTPVSNTPMVYSKEVLRAKPSFGLMDSIMERVFNKKKYFQNRIYLILEDDNTAHTYMIRHSIPIGPMKTPKAFYWLAHNGFNYEADALLGTMKADGITFKGNESCNFFFIDRNHSDEPGTLLVCKTQFTERAMAEIKNAERSKLKDRVAERTYFGISKRWRPQANGDDLMKVLIFGVVFMLITWVVLTNLPGILSTISNGVDVHSVIANTSNTVVGQVVNGTHVSAT